MPTQPQTIPEHGSYFLCESMADYDPSKTAVSLYQMDQSSGMRVQSKAHLRHSVPLADWLSAFEPDIEWFSQRKITLVSEDDAAEIIARHIAYNSLVLACGEYMNTTSFMINDGLARNNPIHSHRLVLSMAKLAAPVPLCGHLITHISHAGDLIYSATAGILSISYMEPTLQELTDFVDAAIKTGFAELEKRLAELKPKAKLRAP